MNALCPPNPCVTTPGMRIVVQTFTASGTYMPSPGLMFAVADCYGAGGGGGTAQNAGAATWCISGGGGGSGGWSRKTVPASLVLGGVVVTIGAGGSGGTIPVGGNGTATSFGALCVANGGTGGNGNGYAEPGGDGAPGNGGVPGIGDLAFPGASGQTGALQVFPTLEVAVPVGGMGGAILGGNSITVAGAPGTSNGNPGAANTGAGGSGGMINQAPPSTAVGGAGGSGLCVVTEYCWADASGGSGSSGCVNVPASGWYGHGGWHD